MACQTFRHEMLDDTMVRYRFELQAWVREIYNWDKIDDTLFEILFYVKEK